MFFIVVGGDICSKLENLVAELLLTTDGGLGLGGIILGLGVGLFLGLFLSLGVKVYDS
jgi:hypothetical protein